MWNWREQKIRNGIDLCVWVHGFLNLLLNSRKMALLMKFLLVVRTVDVYLLKVALHEDVSKLNVAKGI